MSLHNINEMLDRIEGLGIATSQGTVIRLEDVRRLIIQKEIEDEPEEEIPSLKTWDEARHAAAQYLSTEWGPETIKVGRSISASPSAVEGV